LDKASKEVGCEQSDRQLGRGILEKETSEMMNEWINREEEMEYTRDQRRRRGTSLQAKQTKEGRKMGSWSNYATGRRRGNNII
jgi:hypothetical protein